MIDSGARGNWGQITQMCMKGLVANPAEKLSSFQSNQT